MADENEKLLMELLRKGENSICADCKRKGKCKQTVGGPLNPTTPISFDELIALRHCRREHEHTIRCE